MEVHSKRSLYDCANAKVKDSWIGCTCRHQLSHTKTGHIHVRRLWRLYTHVPTTLLQLTVCQQCPDFEPMGDSPFPRVDCGWVPTADEVKRGR